MAQPDDNHRKRRPRRGDMQTLATIVWRALLAAEDVLVEAHEPELKLKAVNAIGQASTHYTKICETLDLERRVRELEEAVKRGVRR
jgi:hypothetical protein